MATIRNPQSQFSNPHSAIRIPHSADFHIHTRYCGHADEDMTTPNIVRQARRAGLETIAITDHLRLESRDEDKAALMKIIREVREADDSIRILTGVEIDADPFHKGKFVLEDRQLLDRLDFVMGSIHHWPDNGAAWYTERNLNAGEQAKIIDDYLAWYEQLALNPLINVMAHPGVFLPATGLIVEFDARICERFSPILDAMRDTGKKFELNELASRKMGEHAWASYGALVNMARERKIPFIVGSDAHSLEQIGRMPNVARLISALFHR